MTIADACNVCVHVKQNFANRFRAVSQSDSDEARKMAEHLFNALHAVEGANFQTMSVHLSCILTPATLPRIDNASWSDDFFVDNVWVDRKDRRKAQPRERVEDEEVYEYGVK